VGIEEISTTSTQAKGETNLRDWLLGSANNAEERAEHTKEGEDGDGDGASSFRLRFDGKDGINLGQLDELEDCLADERNRGSGEGGLRNVSFLLEFLLLLRICGLLNLALDVEGLLSKGFGVRSGVTDVNVAEEDILGHRPEFDTDTADLMKGLNGSLVLKVARVGDLAGGPDTLVRWVVNERSVPFALVFRVGLGGAKIDTKVSEQSEKGYVGQRTVSKDHIQRPLRTWGSLRLAESSHHPLRHPIPRASQPRGRERTQVHPQASHQV